MFVRIFNQDSSRRARSRTFLALGLTLAMSAVACGEDAAPAKPTDGKDSEDEDSEDEDDGTNTGSVKDAGKKPSTAKDAGAPASGDEDEGDGAEEESADKPADAGKAPSTGGGAGAGSWCKVKAISEKYCVSCHDADGTGGSPMPLLTYDDFVAAAPITKGKKVYEVVGTRAHDAKRPMPPKQTLTKDELATLDAFVAAKAPEGDDPTCESGEKAGEGDKPTTPTEAWPPAECDEVYKIVAHGPGGPTDPAIATPGNESHPQVIVDAPWGDEKVQAIMFRPLTDNAKVLHHWILYANSGGAFLTGWAPGDDERQAFPTDIGMNMPTGKQSLRLDMHYFNTMGTQPEKDQSGVEVCIVKGEHLRKNAAAVTMSFASFGNGFVMAPAGAKMAPITGTCNVKTTAPVHLMTASPHAHTYARHMKFVVTKKDKTQIVMHDGAFQFGEQKSYALEPDVVIETGDVVTTTCSYTNDSAKNITFGESTTNEMCFNFASYWPAGALSCSGGGGIPNLSGVFAGEAP